MRKIKVILASRPKIVSDVIRNIIGRQSDMLLLGEVVDPIQLLYVTQQIVVDVVIVTPLKANGEPKVCRHLLEEHPHLKIIVLMPRGEAAYLYQTGYSKKLIEEPCAETILSTIRNSVNLLPG